MSGGLLSLRAAKQYAARFAPEWGRKSDETFCRYLKGCARDEGRLLVRLTPGRTAPYWVRRAVLDRILDANDRGNEATLADHESRIGELEAWVESLRRKLGMPVPTGDF